MIHRVVFGSIERFIGILIEHSAGKFPTWLAPTQVIVLPIADRHNDYCKQLMEKFADAGIRAEMDTRTEKTGYKIREAQLRKIPYMLVVGDRDIENGTVSPRHRADGDLGAMSLDAFTAVLKEVVDTKAKK